MHVAILAWQARILLCVGLGSLILGLAVGADPLTATWRAAAAAWLATWASGHLLRMMAGAVADSLAEAHTAATPVLVGATVKATGKTAPAKVAAAKAAQPAPARPQR